MVEKNRVIKGLFIVLFSTIVIFSCCNSNDQEEDSVQYVGVHQKVFTRINKPVDIIYKNGQEIELGDTIKVGLIGKKKFNN